RPGRGAPAELLEDLRDALDPSRERVRNDLMEEALKGAAAPDPNRYYPLAGTKGDPHPQQLAWSTTSTEPESCNDQFLLVRLRNQLAKGARAPVLRSVQALNFEVYQLLDELIGVWLEQLDQVLGYPDLLKAIAGDGPAADAWATSMIRWPLESDPA